MNEQAKYRTGEQAHFRPNAELRAPFGTVIDEGVVTVTEVVDHGSATAHSPRFTYIVRAADGQTQGTDDLELTKIEPELTSEERRAADFTRDSDELFEYASGVEGVAGVNGELADIAVDVDLDYPDRIGLALGASAVDIDEALVAMTVEQARELMSALQGAIDCASLNRQRM